MIDGESVVRELDIDGFRNNQVIGWSQIFSVFFLRSSTCRKTAASRPEPRSRKLACPPLGVL